MLKLKKGLAVMAAVTMLGTMGIDAFAAQTASIELAGEIFSASCSLDSGSGSAMSRFPAVAGMIVTVRYDYNYGPNQENFRQVQTTRSGAATELFAEVSACPEDINVKNVRVIGTHKIIYNGFSTTLVTSYPSLKGETEE